MSINLRSLQLGVTLIELLIVVAIVAILAGMAYPNYSRFMEQGRRTEAMSELMHLANLQEQRYLDYQRYASSLSDLGHTGKSDNGYYEISLKVTDPVVDFLFTAKAIGSQAGDTDCLNLTLNQDGTKTATSSDCWH